MADNTYTFDLPPQRKSIIKVMGVGGGGSNAVNHMFNLGIKDVEFVVCNTDSQALQSSPVANKLQIGMNLTSGLGAGANPEKGKNAAIESKEDIRELLADDTKMLFITAGMGGGTGTGAAPVIAEIAREADILTVGIVTAPFDFEGKRRMDKAKQGIKLLEEHCDTVLIILNEKIKSIFSSLPVKEAFNKADDVLTIAAKSIAEIITVPGHINVDFEDVKTVMKNSGPAVMGSASASGDNRAARAAEMALKSPLLNNENIKGAEKILLSIMSGEDPELQMDELKDITDHIEHIAGEDAEVIFANGVDSDLSEEVRVTVIATGFGGDDGSQLKAKKKPAPDNIALLKAEIQQQVEQEERQGEIFDLGSPIAMNDIHLLSRREQPNTTSDDEENHHEREASFDFSSLDKSKITPKDFEIEEETSEVHELREEYEPAAPSFSFQFDKPEPENDKEEEDAGGDNHSPQKSEAIPEKPQEEDHPLEELSEGSAHPISRRTVLMEERKRREEDLENAREAQIQHMSADTFKKEWEVPAYERKKVKLRHVPHSSERNMSRYNLTDDNQILGNNKFLDDNVD